MDPIATQAVAEMDKYLFVVLGIIILAGGLGGLVNYYLAQSERKARPESKDSSGVADEFLPWWQAVIIGIAAALLVPLFLNLISSTLLSEAKNDLVKGFVFAGFCLAAGIASRAFIRGISDRLARQALTLAEEAKAGSLKAGEQAQAAEQAAVQVSSQVEEVNAKNSSNLVDAVTMIVSSSALQPPPLPEQGALAGESAAAAISRTSPETELVRLEDEYVSIRQKDAHPNTTRTVLMTRVATQMQALLTGMEEFDVKANLDNDAHIGARLAAIVRLRAKPDMHLLNDLIEKIPLIEFFAAYWAILAIEEITRNKHKSDLPPGAFEAMRNVLARTERSSDRYYKLNQILMRLEK